MNIYEGPPPEAAVVAAAPEQTADEMSKITGAVSRMETEEGENAKHDADMEEVSLLSMYASFTSKCLHRWMRNTQRTGPTQLYRA